MTYKELFLKDKETSQQLAAVTHADWFKRCLAFAKAELMDTPGVTTENLVGARKFEQILMELADTELVEGDPWTQAQAINLVHDLENIPKHKPITPEAPKAS